MGFFLNVEMKDAMTKNKQKTQRQLHNKYLFKENKP